MIDATKTMREADHSGVIPLNEALSIVSEWLQGRVITSPKDYTAVVFFNTVRGVCVYLPDIWKGKAQNLHQFEHVFVFKDLQQPAASYIRDVEKLRGA